MPNQEYDPQMVTQMNDIVGFSSFKRTWIIDEFLLSPEKVLAWFTGNQFGKTSVAAWQYVARILNIHPIKSKNLKPTDTIRTFRFCSQNLPTDASGSEIKNSQYPAIKRYLPRFLIKKDIVIRNPVITIIDPQGGPDIYFEFVSFSQEIQATAGVQRASVWIDESCSKEFFEEQVPRIMASGGDMIYTLTPAEFIGWEFDDIYQRAHKHVRTDYIRRWMKERFGKEVEAHEYNPDGSDIAVFQAATDDNPTMTKKQVDESYELIEDQDIIDIRRYGIFRQVTGQVFKEFDPNIHVLREDKYFQDGIPHGWLHIRTIDYHERNSWACVWMALSNTNECFIYHEYNPSPEKMVTLEIARSIAHRSKDYRYNLNLIDPLAAKKLPNTGSSTVEDFNRIFFELKREGIGTGGYWQTWDTKATVGRERFKERLRNSRLCGRPFNNRLTKDGKETNLPTIWFLDSCKDTIASVKNWRWEEWMDRDQLLTKDIKDKAQQRWSHFPIAIECVMKHAGFHHGRFAGQFVPRHEGGHKMYFGARA